MTSKKQSEVVVRAKKLSKSYDGLSNVLHSISFEVARGESFVVIGPSGSGKTTLLRLVDLLDYPSSGKLLFNGRNTTELGKDGRLQIRRRIGMVFQSTTLFDAKVYSNVAYGLRIRGVHRELEKIQVSRALHTVGLEGLDEREAKTLSGGEAQRVAIARTLAYEPELLLLDEPTANLDPTNTSTVEKAIKRIKEDYGATIIVATHNMFQAKRLADRTALLLDGKFVEVGDPETIFTKPKQQATSDFIEGKLIY